MSKYENNNSPALSLVPMTEAHAVEITTWRYPAPYHHYHMPDWERMKAEHRELADPNVRSLQYRSIFRKDELYGYLQWFLLTAVEGPDLVRLGIGKRPDACGQGNGSGAAFVGFIVRETAKHYPERIIDLEVAEDNKRAIRAYEQAGFRIADTYELPHPTEPRTVTTLNMIYPYKFPPAT